MISFEQISDYVNSLLKLKNDGTDELYNYLSKKGHPVVKRDVAEFLAQIVLLKQPEKVLEIGTNVGYSAIMMARQMKNGKIWTVDYRRDHHDKALENFKEFGVEDRIVLITSYAENVLNGLDGGFDLIFIDADKKGYSNYLDFAVNNLNSRGVIIADNLFWKGSVIAPDGFEDERNVIPSLTEFNKKFVSLKGFRTQVLSIGDGLGFAVKEN